MQLDWEGLSNTRDPSGIALKNGGGAELAPTRGRITR